MKNDKNSIFAIVIFFFGLSVLLFALGYILFRSEYNLWAALLTSVYMVIVYVALFIPGFFLINNKDKSGHSFVGIGIYYWGYVPYAIASVVVSVMLRTGKLSMMPAFILYGGILFVFLIYVFFASVTNSHLADTGADVQEKMSGVQALRSQADMLAARKSQLGAEYDSLQKMMQQLCDDMRYLSPSDNPDAVQLENQMLYLFQDINQDSFFANSANVSGTGVMEKMKRIEALYQQRKAIF